MSTSEKCLNCDGTPLKTGKCDPRACSTSFEFVADLKVLLEPFEFDGLGNKTMARILEAHPELTEEAEEHADNMACGCGICVSNHLYIEYPELNLQQFFQPWRLNQ